MLVKARVPNSGFFATFSVWKTEEAVMVEDLQKKAKLIQKIFLISRKKDSKGRDQQNLPNKNVIY